MDADLTNTLAELLVDPGTAFMCGSFGAVAEFMRDAGEAMDAGPGLQAVTARGGVRITPGEGLVALAYEMPGRRSGWTQALELCLPKATLRGTARDVVTELGPDADALRPSDRGAILFDLGLSLLHAEFCVRTSDPEALDVLRSGCGIPLLAGNPAGPAMPRLSPHRVVRSAIGRVEVYQAIPPPDGRSPDGPHTHLLPKLLAHGRTHAANLPIPPGLVPCLSVFPVSALIDGALDRHRWDRFQELLERYADREWLVAKQDAAQGRPPGRTGNTRLGAMARRVAERQAGYLSG